MDEGADGADGADDRGDGDGDDRTDVTEGVSFVLGARANGFPLPPSVSGSRGSRTKKLGGSDGRPTQKGKRNRRFLANLIFSSPGSSRVEHRGHTRSTSSSIPFLDST